MSLLHESGWSTARIAAYVGHEKLSTTSDVYTHVMGDRREVDYSELLAACPAENSSLDEGAPITEE